MKYCLISKWQGICLVISVHILFILKMSGKFFIAFVLITLTTAVYAQRKSLLSIPYRSELLRAPIHQFLDDLNNNNGTIIQYASNIVDANRVVELDGTEATVGALLKKVLTGQKVKLLEKNGKLLLIGSTTIINTDELVPLHTIYGFVKERGSLEPLIGATIIEETSHKGIVTNSFGYFSLSLPEGRHRLSVSYIGFENLVMDITLERDVQRDIELSIKQEAVVLQAIVVPATEALLRTGSASVGTQQYDGYNYMMGEDDPLRSAYLLPGVKNIPSSFNGMFVRGGGADENLFLMDGNVVFNPTHILGALSIVNHTSLKSMRLFKSDFPSRYAGATSSVIDVRTKDGNMEQWGGEAEAGTLSGSFTMEGPVVKNKTAVMASFRHSWPQEVLSFFQKDVITRFYDAHFKATQLINRKNKLMLNFYNGQDEVRQSLDNTNNLNKWGNLIGSFIWNRTIGSRSFINNSINMSTYKNLGGMKYTLYGDDGDGDDGDDDTDNDVDDEILESASVSTLTSMAMYSIKSQAEVYVNPKIKFDFGAELAHTIIKPFETKLGEEIDDDETNFVSSAPLSFIELSGYGESEFKIGKRIFVRPGLHFSAYQYSNYQHLSFQPRFFASYKIAPHHQLFTSYARMTQYLHLVTNPYQKLNADTWVPSTERLQPEQSETYNFGYEYNNGSGIRSSIEGYWKSLDHVTDYADGKSYLTNSKTWEQNVNTGYGWAYGAEWLIQKTSGHFTTLISYTLAWSWRRFNDINNGEQFPYKYDRRHSLNTGLGYEINRHFSITALWSYSSGDAFSVPDYAYPDFDQLQRIRNPADILKDYRFVYNTSMHNQFRSSPFNRLDAALNYHTNKDRKNRLKVTAGVYNILQSPDQYQYNVRGSSKEQSRIIGNGFRTFSRTPYIAVSFKF